MNAHILVVDDEKDLVNLLRYNLKKANYEVSCAYDGSSVLPQVQTKPPQLIILDLMLPDRSGYDICRDLKANPATQRIPIIMLTARSSEYNRVTGFESGVDDYVIKPFSPRELVLRVKALLARTAASEQQVPSALHSQDQPPGEAGEQHLLPGSRLLQMGMLRLDIDSRRCFVNEREVPLTQTEFDTLLHLAQYPDRVQTREQLLNAVWGEEAELVLDRSVDALVKRLRAKLGEARDMIETVRGLGYRLNARLDDTPSESYQKTGVSSAQPLPEEVVS